MKYILPSDPHNKFWQIEFCRKNYPDHKIIVAGDLTNNGWRMEFDKVPSLDYVAPGNHDKGAFGNLFNKHASRRFDEKFGTKFHGRWSKPKVVFNENEMLILCDSCLETWFFHHMAQGGLGWFQRMWLKHYVNSPRYADLIKIVVFHHHPFLRGIENYPLKMIDADKVMEILKGKIKVLNFGHKHKFERCTKQEEEFGIPFILAGGSPEGRGDENRNYAWQLLIEDKQINVNKVRVCDEH